MNKIIWVDTFKGFGILAVVVGHIYIGEISRNIYIFHMPLFFFLSGYLFKPTLEYKKYFIKKVVHLLMPYFFFLISIYISYNGFPSLKLKEIIIYFSEPIIGGRMLTGALGVFWFVTCLFLTQQLMNYLINKLNSKSLLVLMGLFITISFINTYIYTEIWLPWNANVIVASAPLFYLGYIYKTSAFKINYITLVTLGIVVLLFSFIYPQNVYGMKNAYYGIPIITLISSIILVLNIKLISEKLSKFKISNRILSEIGKASMVIMYLHQPIQILTKSYLSDNYTIRFLTATIISYTIYLILAKFKFGRALFLGSYNDLKQLTGKTSPNS